MDRELFVREHGEGVALNLLPQIVDLLQHVAATGRQPDHYHPAVLLAGAALDQPLRRHAVDQGGGGGGRHVHAAADIAHAQTALVRRGDAGVPTIKQVQDHQVRRVQFVAGRQVTHRLLGQPEHSHL